MSVNEPTTGISGGRDASELPDIPGYKLSRVIGDGGMSTVYLARQVSLGREVAIKVMLPDALADEVSRRRFENEARTIARLEHPHIVGIFEVGRTTESLPYYAMPYLPNGHLGQRNFTSDEQGQARVRAILEDLIGALAYAHARGVVHRDVKSENVLFDEAERPLLADFGIALRRGFGSRVTTAGLAVGSTAYMAPEQARGEQVDARADLYSVGVLAWEMLTGRLPFVAGDALSMAVKHAQDPVPRLPRHLRHWQRFLDNALAKSPAQRHGNAQLMRAALDRVPRLGGQPLTDAMDGLRRGLKRMRRWPAGIWIGILLAVAMALGAGLRQLPDRSGDSFFRAAAEGDGQSPALDDVLATGGLDAADGMLRPLPVSPAEHWLTTAAAQLNSHKLIAPERDNAYDSLLAGWKADPDNPGLVDASTGLIAALADEASRRVAASDDARVAGYLSHASELAGLAGGAGNEAMVRLRKRVTAAYQVRVDDAAADFDRASALRVASAARAAGVGARDVAALEARARRVPQSGDALADAPGMRLVGSGKTLVALSTANIERDAYQRFATATRRPAALCRQRSSLLRIVKPIAWQSPGFEQSPGQAVVCVSWSDADAYANWLGQQDGHRYRLPTAAEARLLPTSAGPRSFSEWVRDCRNDCRERMAIGRSWREKDGPRALDPTRGYDDVGFRLVREP